MTTRLDAALDVLHTFSKGVERATRRKRRLRREHIAVAAQAGGAIAAAVATFVPQAKPVAAVLCSLNAAMPVPNAPAPTKSYGLRRHIARLETLNLRLQQTPPDDPERHKIVAQQEVILEMMEEDEQGR